MLLLGVLAPLLFVDRSREDTTQCTNGHHILGMKDTHTLIYPLSVVPRVSNLSVTRSLSTEAFLNLTTVPGPSEQS